MILSSLYVAQSDSKGRGVFTSEFIATGTTIEISPVIVMTAEDRVLLDKTKLYDYIFEWGEDKKEAAMALGLIPIYNHSYASNAEYFMFFAEAEMMIKTVRDIAVNEEIVINYNGDWNDETRLWFEAE